MTRSCPWCERAAGDPACDCARMPALARQCGALVEQAVATMFPASAATHASGEMRADVGA